MNTKTQARRQSKEATPSKQTQSNPEENRISLLDVERIVNQACAFLNLITDRAIKDMNYFDDIEGPEACGLLGLKDIVYGDLRRLVGRNVEEQAVR